MTASNPLRHPLQRLQREETLLLIVDVQERLLPAMAEAEQVESNCVLLARAARQLAIPVLVTEQYPQRLGATVPGIAGVIAGAQPHAKMLFSACTDATLAAIGETRRRTVLLCGIEAHVCVLQTALDLIEQEFEVFVAYDAISSRQPSNKQIGWERMRAAGALPTSTESAVFELLREAGTPDFKALLPFIK